MSWSMHDDFAKLRIGHHDLKLRSLIRQLDVPTVVFGYHSKRNPELEAPWGRARAGLLAELVLGYLIETKRQFRQCGDGEFSTIPSGSVVQSWIERLPTANESSLLESSTMATSSLPARSLRRLVQTTDVDQARQTFAKIYSTTVIEPAPDMPFGYTLDIVSIGAVHITEDKWSGGGYLTAPAIGERYILSFSAEGVVEGTIGGETFISVPGRRGALFSAQQPSTLTIGIGYWAQNITIDRAALEAHFTALTGQEVDGPICFAAEMDLTHCSGAAIYNIAQLLRRETERPDPSRLVVASLRDALFTAVLTGHPHNASSLLSAPTPRVMPGCVRKAEEYITAHAAEPITLEDIVTAVGVPARSLQATFQSHRGTTPMAFLRDRRLELARERLLGASPTATVGEITRDLGITSPGRFSGEYTKRFGESPSETLARAVEREIRRSIAR